MKKAKLNLHKRLVLILSTLMLVNLVFSHVSFQTNAAGEATVQGDHNSDGNLDVTDLVGWVDDGESSSDDAESLRTELLRIVETSVENDDGTFEENTGNISLYSVSELSGASSHATWQNDTVTFQGVETESGTVMSIKSTDGSDGRGALAYIKFGQALKANTEYEITYDANWTGETLPTTVYQYAILQSVDKWITSTNSPIVAYNTTKTGTVFDGEVSITLTPTETYSECYLVLYLDKDQPHFDMQIDNIRIQQKYLLGVGEGTSEINTEVESTLAIDYVSEVTGTMGAKSYRLWMHLNRVLSVDENNNVTINQPVASAFHRFIDSLKAQGVERFICTSSRYLYPNGYQASTNHVIPDPETESEEYQEFLEILSECYRVIAEEFPEICYFEPGNEPDIASGQNICQNGYIWGETTEYNENYLYTDDEITRILADLMWYTRRAVTQVNDKNKVLIPGLCGYNGLPDYLDKIYEVIESGEFPTGETVSTDPDEYFDILNWHPYLMSEGVGVTQMDETWVQFQKDVYQVAESHGDGEKHVWFTEMGFSDRGYTDRLDVTKENMIKMFEYVTNELEFVETVFLFRISNLTGSASINEYEDNIGLFYSLNNEDEALAGQPKPMTVALYQWLYGDNVELAPLYALADWNIDGRILENAVRNDDGTFEGNSGIYSLLTPGLIKGSEGETWSNKISFREILSDGDHKVQVTSSGNSSIDYLYIKVDAPIQTDCSYTVQMDLNALDSSSLNGKYGYWVLSPEATTASSLQEFQKLTGEELFKENATFEFTSNGNYDYFYLVFRENMSNETEAIQFNFSIDNIRFEEK